MRLIQNFWSWLGVKLDAWLTKVSNDNRPYDRDYDGFPEQEPLFTQSDSLGEERGDWGDRLF